MRKKASLLILLLVVIVGGLVIWQYRTNTIVTQMMQRGSSLWNTSQRIRETIATSAQPALEQVQPYISELASGSAFVASRAAAVLGTTTGLGDVASQPATLIEGTAQYARYWYCKQVVDSYEQQNKQ